MENDKQAHENLP